MSSLDSLLRLHRWALDEKRQKLMGLERLQDRMLKDMKALEEELARESRAAALAGDEVGLAYPGYAASVMQRRQRLEASIAELSRSIEAAREEVAESYQDFKKYETAQSNQERRKDLRRRQREQREADDLGLELHRRRAAR